MLPELLNEPITQRVEAARVGAQKICDEDVSINSRIGAHGLEFLTQHCHLAQKDMPFNILTHCNAGWLATVDWGTALAPIYKAHDAGIPVHVWVDETRPRNQGASLTCWELGQHGVPHTLIVDNVGGHLMQHGMVDLCITGTDRTTAAGDVCNKIGTYLKALAADDNNVPFYVGLPGPTIDWSLGDGADIPAVDDQSGLAVHDGLRSAARAAGHHRHPGRRRLEVHDAQTLDVQAGAPRPARHREHVGHGVVGG